MAKCDQCGAHENLPYKCRHCGGTYCAEHRLPENHDCPGLENWGDPDGVFDSGFDDSVRSDLQSDAGSMAERLGLHTGTGGVFGYFRGNMSFVFLALMWTTFMLQLLVGLFASEEQLIAIFVLSSEHVLRVWTWFTSIFAHGGFFHIAINSIVLYFFGPPVERRVGSRNFTLLFLGSGVVAGLSQVMVEVLFPTGKPVEVVGASGAIMAVMGVLTVLNPKLRVYLWFLLPVPLWLLTIGFAAYSVLMVAGDPTAGNIAHIAHLAGLAVGLAYGEKLRREGARAPEQLRFGGGPGGPGGRRRF